MYHAGDHPIHDLDPPISFDEYFARCERLALADTRSDITLVTRRKDTRECLGMTAIESLEDEFPQMGIWIKETAHNQGYGREVIEAVTRWASDALNKAGYIYPVAIQNFASRRIAEGLGGEIIATRSSTKYDSVVYRIPAWK